MEGTKTVVKSTGTETTTGDMIEHRRLQIDARKWMLAKALPKVCGDRLTAEVTGKDGGPIETVSTPVKVARRLALLLAAGMQTKDEGEEASTRRHGIPSVVASTSRSAA